MFKAEELHDPEYADDNASVSHAPPAESVLGEVEYLPGGQRVLVAEDNAVTNDLLRILLAQRGHVVDIVQDGRAALKALQENEYDVVLLDFHLPELDGIEVARRFRAELDGPDAPRLVAITADMKGLLGHEGNCETFDTVVPKPLNLDNVCKVVEGELILPGDARPLPSARPAQPAAAAAAVPAETESRSVARYDGGLAQQGFRLFRWPDDLELIETGGTTGSELDLERFDAVLVCERATVSDLSFLWAGHDLHLLPVIDLSGTLGPRADLDASKLGITDTAAVERLVLAFNNRRRSLSRDFRKSDKMADKLLGRVRVSGSDLKPHYWPEDPTLVAYNVALPSADVQREADALVTGGLLKSEFFERVHQCDRCKSSRLHVREECRHCGSANLHEESYLHHFVCAFQAPESQFREDNDLVCPKCRRELTHFSIDYDRPGSMVCCGSCGHSAADPEVGFVCLDCHAHHKGEAVKHKDVHSYALSEQGTAVLKNGRAIMGDTSAVTRMSELPLALAVALNGALKRHAAEAIDFALAEITYANAHEIEQADGPRQLRNTRENIMDSLRAALGNSECVHRGGHADYVLVEGANAAVTRRGLEVAIAEAVELLARDPGCTLRVFGASELAA
ncbi:response regulator [Tepidamorphus sp. 3E244]|uniref:TackOD1 domain-containing metal-binding protein n=1 Tax=Tepidamorphus sp. 3E244 TaxID=3385498 RepID=UPI0038FBEE1A